jgi:hypothetical protein
MARLESPSRLRWPRRIMVSMTSLRNRLAAAPSPSSPFLSSETVMIKKPTTTVRVPCHLRFAARFPTSTATGSDRKTTSPRTWISDASRASQTAKRGSANRVRRRRAWMQSVEPPPRCPLRRWRFGGSTGQGHWPQQAPGETTCAFLGLRRPVRERSPAFSSSAAISPRFSAGAW